MTHLSPAAPTTTKRSTFGYHMKDPDETFKLRDFPITKRLT
jgi:hypothetical protein